MVRFEPITRQEILDYQVDVFVDYAHEEILRNLFYIGESVVREVRNNGSYLNQTGNLRSSTGYAVFYNGSLVKMSDFIPVLATATKAKDKSTAFINELSMQLKGVSGYVLVCVAGMEYAAYVSLKGYDVLDSGTLIAEKLFNSIFTQNNN